MRLFCTEKHPPKPKPESPTVVCCTCHHVVERITSQHVKGGMGGWYCQEHKKPFDEYNEYVVTYKSVNNYMVPDRIDKFFYARIRVDEKGKPWKEKKRAGK